MFREITIGQYYDADSIIHKMDPRTKLMGVIVYIIVLFLIQNPLWYIACLASILALFAVSKVPFGFFLKGLKAIIILLLFTLIFRMLYTPGETLYEFWIFTITREGIYKAVGMTSRVALMITSASLLAYTSTPKQLADGMEKGLSFLSKIKVPIHDMAVITMIAFRFIPILMEEMNTLLDAQAARGARMEEADVIEKCKNVIALLMPLFMSTVRKASDLAMAMEARGYTGEAHATKMYPLSYKTADKVAYCIYALVLVAFIALRIKGLA